MEETKKLIQKKVGELVADAKTAEDVLRLANTLAVLHNITSKG